MLLELEEKERDIWLERWVVAQFRLLHILGFQQLQVPIDPLDFLMVEAQGKREHGNPHSLLVVEIQSQALPPLQ